MPFPKFHFLQTFLLGAMQVQTKPCQKQLDFCWTQSLMHLRPADIGHHTAEDAVQPHSVHTLHGDISSETQEVLTPATLDNRGMSTSQPSINLMTFPHLYLFRQPAFNGVAMMGRL